jgi:23S rRNA (adenine1618-N6)-methyltransferase
MSTSKKAPAAKNSFHPKSKHNDRYDFALLIEKHPALKAYVAVNKFGNESIDFFDPEAVKSLNIAILKLHYGVSYWDIPEGYLCPPIPGRADYIHYIADLLGDRKEVNALDVGVGANCIYPIVGVAEYDWNFTGAEVDKVSLISAQKIINNNPSLKNKVELRFQRNAKDIFKGIIKKGERFDVSICNPPFHASKAEAAKGTARKLKNLGKKVDSTTLNFGGQSNELFYDGGEITFIKKMILQSKRYEAACKWYTTLVSKEENLEKIYKALKEVRALEVKTIPMTHGNKKSRIVAWSFLK